jgi:uncharacterized protein involved in outer membrane biogenesis
VIRRLLLLITTLVVIILAALGGFAYWMLAGDGVRLALERQASAWLGHPVRIAVARPRLFPQPGLHLERVEVGDPVRLTLGTVDVSSDGRALFSRRIEHATVSIANSRIEMPLPFALPSTADAPAATPADGSIRLVSIDSIALDDIVVASRGRELTVSADSALDGSRLLLRKFSARTAPASPKPATDNGPVPAKPRTGEGGPVPPKRGTGEGGTALDAEGEVDLTPRIDARLKVKANRLDVDELMALASAFAPPPAASGRRTSGEPARIAARLSAESASAGGVNVQQFATDLEVVGGRVSLSPLTFQLFGGRYQGSLTATLRDSLSATLRSRVIDVDVAQLAEFGGSPGSITGRLTGAGTFSGSGADFGSVLNSARGDGTATVVNGSIRHLDLVRTVILFFGRPAPDAGISSDRFDRLDASFSLANRLVAAQAFSLHSTDADIVGNGTLALESKALAGRVDLSLSEALTRQAGTDLARYTREGNRIILPANIGGTLDKPRITIDAAAAVKRGLRNEIQRRLGGLLDRFRRGQTQSEP